jgi:NADPH:quinone reductase-like Zn-dependent oxidoreductase
MVRVVRSTIIDAPIDAVWGILRNFNDHERWHPAVRLSTIEDRRAPDEIGCIRDFALNNGGEIREQLLSLSDKDYELTYCILDATVPLRNYTAHVKLRPVTDGTRTFWHWESRFDPPPERAEELAAMVARDIYEAGFQAARAVLSGAAALPTAPRHAEVAPTPRRAPAALTSAVPCKAVVVRAYGGPDRLQYEDSAAPAPGPGEVQIRHTAIGVNYIDVYCRTGYFTLLTPPGTPGMEAAGVVLRAGDGVSLKEGQRVAYACAPVGAYAEVRTMPADLVLPLPDGIADALAAAALLKAMTAEFLLHRVHPISEGETILVHAAAGGVGQLICQWARALGATVIGTAAGAAKLRIAQNAGCAHVIDYSAEDFVPRVHEITGGHGVQAAFDAVGRDTFAKSFEALARRGHLISFGQASGPLPPVDVAAFSSKSATVSRPNFGHYTGTRAEAELSASRVFRALQTGILTVAPPTRYALRDAAIAHRALESRATTGSLILIP